MPAKKRPTVTDSAAPENVPATPAAPTPSAPSKAASKKTAKPAAKGVAKRSAKSVAKAPATGATASVATPRTRRSSSPAPAQISGAGAPVAPAAPQRAAVSEEQIREHAYFLSLRRQGASDVVADWFEAERSLRTGIA